MYSSNPIRNKILQLIAESSSIPNLNEGCSITYANLNLNKLQEKIHSFFQTNVNFHNVEFAPSATISQVADYIKKRLPAHATNCLYSQTTTKNHNNPQSEFTSHKTTNMKKQKYEYVIGIDFGHGETSAAICPLQWDTPVEQLDPAKDLEMGGNKKVIPSAITILDNGVAQIGDSAFKPENLQQAEVHICFKKAPQDINGKNEKIMMRYMKEVYLRIRENNPAMLTDNNHLVYIATPSGWNKSTQNLYLQMARQAGLPIAGLTKESRAAFVRAQHDVTSGIGKYIEKGAVVFDMGSSTLDFTYMSSNRKMIDHGYV